jgi:hypothetical protein
MANYIQALTTKKQYDETQAKKKAEKNKPFKSSGDYNTNYQYSVDELRNMMEKVQTGEIPPELLEAKELFAPGGKYMTSAETRIKQTQAQGTAGAMASSIASGMGGYGTTGGAAARFAREAELSMADVESQRYDKYAGALGAIAQVRLNQMQQQIDIAKGIANVYSNQAGTQADVYTTTRGQDIQQQLGQGQLNLNRYQVSSEAAARNAGLQEQKRQFDVSHKEPFGASWDIENAGGGSSGGGNYSPSYVNAGS